ncbi:hypothetical protein ACLOJK_024995 [Asimina triloba]
MGVEISELGSSRTKFDRVERGDKRKMDAEEEGMEVFEKASEEIEHHGSISKSSQLLDLLRSFLNIQQRRAEAYSKLRSGFSEFMMSGGPGGEWAYQQLCGEITIEFNDCSKQVLEMQSMLLNPDISRDDLAALLKAVQAQEKQKLHLNHLNVHHGCLNDQKTAKIQLLKKAGRPSERLISHENCKFRKPAEHECAHLLEITEAMGTEDAEADAEYDNALKEAIKGVQDAVTNINEHLEEVRYEIEALEAEEQTD